MRWSSPEFSAKWSLISWTELEARLNLNKCIIAESLVDPGLPTSKNQGRLGLLDAAISRLLPFDE